MKWLKIMLNCHYRNVNINNVITFLEAKLAIVTVRSNFFTATTFSHERKQIKSRVKTDLKLNLKSTRFPTSQQPAKL